MTTSIVPTHAARATGTSLSRLRSVATVLRRRADPEAAL